MVRKGIQARDRLVPAAREFVIYGGNHALEGALGSFKAHKANLSSKPALEFYIPSLSESQTRTSTAFWRDATFRGHHHHLQLTWPFSIKKVLSILIPYHGAEKEAAKMPATMQLLRTAGALHAANLYSRLLTQK